jgi:DNA-binding response OmpR family regulator
LFNILVIAQEDRLAVELSSGLAEHGFICAVMTGGSGVIEQVSEPAPDLVLVAADSYVRVREFTQGVKQARPLPVVALVHRETLDNVNGHLDAVDDFVIAPCDVRELVLRLRRLLRQTGITDDSALIQCGDLVIDIAKYEVSVAGRRIMLTFKEYELLKFLASNRGRVFTREALLDKVWGYDYYGGDRTVDVHIRRLRSKIEDSTHFFIETVRNIGYRFRKDAT